MCFYLKSKADVPKIAVKDIICYKYTDKENRGLFSFKSYHQIDFKYLRWTKNPIISLSVSYENEIYEGYHSLKENLHYMGTGKFKIPKGSLYYENDEQYVSNQLIYLGPIYFDK